MAEKDKTIDKNNLEDREKKRLGRAQKEKIEMQYVYRSISCIGRVVSFAWYGFSWEVVVVCCGVFIGYILGMTEEEPAVLPGNPEK